jgi:hypothetical protein
MRPILLALGIIWPCTLILPAQDSSELLARLEAMEERIRTLEAEVQALKSQQVPAASTQAAPEPQAQPAPPAAQVPAAQPPSYAKLPTYGGETAASKAFNPAISLVGDFLGAAGSGASRPTPALEMHESELGMQAILDPYARADFFLSFGEEGVDLEEGYITFPALPGGFQVRAGKIRSSFGTVNTMHNHALPWTDRPLVTQNLLAGEEGITDAGLSISRILPAPGEIFLEGTAQLFRGDSEGLFESTRRSNLLAVTHLRGYRDISESTNLDLGFSYARGHNTFGPSLVTQIYGVDATLRWKPLRRAIYRSFVARSEFVWSRAEQTLGTTKPFGYYVSGEYQLSRRWFLGGRFDRSERMSSPLARDTGGSILLTYWPSEFSQVRGQLRRTRYAERMTANEFLFQFLFSIGAHAAHPF